MRALDKKLARDFVRMWAQVLAVALVLASGVATLVLALGALRSLEDTRTAYYERYSFADVFASVTRAPLHLVEKLETVPGVAAVDTRIRKLALLDVPGVLQPATGLFMSLPDRGEPKLNRLHLRAGRSVEAGRVDEVVVNEAFALAHRLAPGAPVKAILNGRLRTLTVVGIALSPEFIYAVGPGDIMPDDRRFGIFWMSRQALASIFDLEGAFNSVALKVSPGASEAAVIESVDSLLGRYGGTGAMPRKDQTSHAFLDAELKQLSALARVMPPIFLLVAAFLINIILSRLIALEREQIGLLKAVGYAPTTIALHYVQFVLAIAAAGILIGALVGAQLGHGLTRLYGEFFHFPFLIFSQEPAVYVIAAVVSVVAAVAGALKAVVDVLQLPAAVAMQPPAPPRFRRWTHGAPHWWPATSQIVTMAFRNMLHWPLRALFTLVGIALACGLMVTALMSFDAIELMVDVAFNRMDRQHATIEFGEPIHPRATRAVAELPGVMRTEPYRSAPVRLINGARSRQMAITGLGDSRDLGRVLDAQFRPVPLPPKGIAIGERVAEILALRPGDRVTVQATAGKRRLTSVTVTEVINSYFGLGAFMRLDELDDLLDEGPRVTGVRLSYDKAKEEQLFKAVKRTPAIAAIALNRVSLARFRETIAKNMDYMVTVYTVLAVVITFGVVYNSARIQLSERARELASLRVLGFTRAEVSWVLLAELAIITLCAIPLGWLFGYGFGRLLVESFTSDLYRVPFVIDRTTYATAAALILGAAVISALVVRRRVDHLDLVSVLKTRD